MSEPPDIKLAWVYLAALLAFTEEQCGDDKLAAIKLARKIKSPRGQRKLQAYLRDPDNQAKILACHRQAAEMLGLSGETRH